MDADNAGKAESAVQPTGPNINLMISPVPDQVTNPPGNLYGALLPALNDKKPGQAIIFVRSERENPFLLRITNDLVYPHQSRPTTL